MLLFLDAQIGHSTVRDSVAHLLPYPEDESVHLALDPEFAMGSGGGAPGSRIGSLDATDVNAAIDPLVELVDRLALSSDCHARPCVAAYASSNARRSCCASAIATPHRVWKRRMPEPSTSAPYRISP